MHCRHGLRIPLTKPVLCSITAAVYRHKNSTAPTSGLHTCTSDCTSSMTANADARQPPWAATSTRACTAIDNSKQEQTSGTNNAFHHTEHWCVPSSSMPPVGLVNCAVLKTAHQVTAAVRLLRHAVLRPVRQFMAVGARLERSTLPGTTIDCSVLTLRMC